MVRFAYQKSSAPVWRRDCGKGRLQGEPSLSRTLWLTAVTVEVDRGPGLVASLIDMTKYRGQSDLWEEELIFGSWFLISFSLSWRGVHGGRSSLPGVDQGSVRSLQPEKDPKLDCATSASAVVFVTLSTSGHWRQQSQHHSQPCEVQPWLQWWRFSYPCPALDGARDIKMPQQPSPRLLVRPGLAQTPLWPWSFGIWYDNGSHAVTKPVPPDGLTSPVSYLQAKQSPRQ
nr:uncharacterized protein LOC121821982 [Peromyscus maniculatus bairdii]